MTTLEKDIKTYSSWLVNAFAALDKKLDYSVESVKHIEELISNQFKDGKPHPDGLFAAILGLE